MYDSYTYIRIMPATPSSPLHLANALGALALVLSDRISSAAGVVATQGPSAPAALVALNEFLDGGSINQLRAVLGLTHSGTVRLVDRLEGEGLIRREAAQDARAVSLRLTRRGRVAAARIHGARQAVLQDALSSLTDDDLVSLGRALDVILETVTMVRQKERAKNPVDAPAWLCRLCDFEACEREAGKCPVAQVSGSTVQSV
jgi:MarR family transcriptional regulator, negative regulator of the multidrug operon emrRAB